MSMTLFKDAVTTIVLPLAQRLSNGFVHQLYGATFAQVDRVTTTLNVGKTDTAKTRAAVVRTYTTASGETKRAYASIEFTVPGDCPQAVAEEMTFMVSDLARENVVVSMVKTRSLIES